MDPQRGTTPEVVAGARPSPPSSSDSVSDPGPGAGKADSPALVIPGQRLQDHLALIFVQFCFGLFPVYGLVATALALGLGIALNLPGPVWAGLVLIALAPGGVTSIAVAPPVEHCRGAWAA